MSFNRHRRTLSLLFALAMLLEKKQICEGLLADLDLVALQLTSKDFSQQSLMAPTKLVKYAANGLSYTSCCSPER